MTDNDSREIKIAICKKLMEIYSCDFHYIYEEVFEHLCSEIVDALQNTDPEAKLKEFEQLAIEQKQFEQIEEDLLEQNIIEYRKFIDNITLEPNKLSDDAIIALCHEFYNDFVKHHEDKEKFPNMPAVEIIKLGDYINVPSRHDQTIGYQGVSYWLHEQIPDPQIRLIRSRLPLQSGSFIDYIGKIININLNTFGGIIQHCHDAYKNLCYDKCKILKIENPYLQKFWDWYTKSLDVLAMYYLKKDNTCYVIKKPDELKIDVDKKEIYFRYGQEEFYYKNKVKLPVWLYKTKADDLKTEDFLLLQNADTKAVFIEKFGIDRLAKLGTVIDSYENYPDNEMWAKSEYKIIDMHKIIPARERIDRWKNSRGRAKPFTYAPFLYMKNQTTGVYHLEGIHPRCKTLYDAIKMRYKGLNIKDFEIKDIK